MHKIPKTEGEWRKRLPPDRFRVLRLKGTEPPFINEFANHKEKGKYLCAGCGAELFSSETKYDSGTGWPNFYAPISGKKVKTNIDESNGMRRVEVSCARCGGHLGHLFDDGPEPTGLRYCLNSAALELGLRCPCIQVPVDFLRLRRQYHADGLVQSSSPLVIAFFRLVLSLAIQEIPRRETAILLLASRYSNITRRV